MGLPYPIRMPPESSSASPASSVSSQGSTMRDDRDYSKGGAATCIVLMACIMLLTAVGAATYRSDLQSNIEIHEIWSVLAALFYFLILISRVAIFAHNQPDKGASMFICITVSCTASALACLGISGWQSPEQPALLGMIVLTAGFFLEAKTGIVADCLYGKRRVDPDN